MGYVSHVGSAAFAAKVETGLHPVFMDRVHLKGK
jgi:hypothetical protein